MHLRSVYGFTCYLTILLISLPASSTHCLADEFSVLEDEDGLHTIWIIEPGSGSDTTMSTVVSTLAGKSYPIVVLALLKIPFEKYRGNELVPIGAIEATPYATTYTKTAMKGSIVLTGHKISEFFQYLLGGLVNPDLLTAVAVGGPAWILANLREDPVIDINKAEYIDTIHLQVFKVPSDHLGKFLMKVNSEYVLFWITDKKTNLFLARILTATEQSIPYVLKSIDYVQNGIVPGAPSLIIDALPDQMLSNAISTATVSVQDVFDYALSDWDTITVQHEGKPKCTVTGAWSATAHGIICMVSAEGLHFLLATLPLDPALKKVLSTPVNHLDKLLAYQFLRAQDRYLEAQDFSKSERATSMVVVLYLFGKSAHMIQRKPQMAGFTIKQLLLLLSYVPLFLGIIWN